MVNEFSSLPGPSGEQPESSPPQKRKALIVAAIVLAALAFLIVRWLPVEVNFSFESSATSPSVATDEEREALSQEANVVLTQAIIQAIAGEEVDLEELIRQSREDKVKREDPAEIRKREQAEARQFREKTYLERWNTP